MTELVISLINGTLEPVILTKLAVNPKNMELPPPVKSAIINENLQIEKAIVDKKLVSNIATLEENLNMNKAIIEEMLLPSILDIENETKENKNAILSNAESMGMNQDDVSQAIDMLNKEEAILKSELEKEITILKAELENDVKNEKAILESIAEEEKALLQKKASLLEKAENEMKVFYNALDIIEASDNISLDQKNLESDLVKMKMEEFKKLINFELENINQTIDNKLVDIYESNIETKPELDLPLEVKKAIIETELETDKALIDQGLEVGIAIIQNEIDIEKKKILNNENNMNPIDINQAIYNLTKEENVLINELKEEADISKAQLDKDVSIDVNEMSVQEQGQSPENQYDAPMQSYTAPKVKVMEDPLCTKLASMKCAMGMWCYRDENCLDENMNTDAFNGRGCMNNGCRMCGVDIYGSILAECPDVSGLEVEEVQTYSVPYDATSDDEVLSNGGEFSRDLY